MTAVENLLGRLQGVKKATNGWIALCPAHDDHSPSLSISGGEDGRALVHCHAGCTSDDVCGAVGLSHADLFDPSTRSTSTEPRPSGEKRRFRRRAKRKSTVQAFASADEAVAHLEHRLGPSSDQWTYQDENGEPVGVVIRWDLPNGRKSIQPVNRRGGRWRIGGMSAPRPLYRLPELANAKRVYVCEGEKAAEAARLIGLVTTTSAHGAESPRKTDWRPLAGKEVIILPDNDAAGRKYADQVRLILHELGSKTAIKEVELPNLPVGGDIADFFDGNAGVGTDELRRQIEVWAEAADPIEPPPPAVPLQRFESFPVEALPEPVRRFVIAGAKAIGCDSSFLAIPLLTVLAAAIGNSRRIQLKQGWNAPAILWMAIVGESGSAKTPAFRLAMRPVYERERKVQLKNAERERDYQSALTHHAKRMAQWKHEKNSKEGPPDKPNVPLAERFLVSDTTVEALAPILSANPRGLLLACDELAGWFGSFDRYSGAKGGADSAHWLSMHTGESVVVDRKTGIPSTIFIPNAAVSVCGGIQPGVLHRALGKEHRESGLAARILLAYPPRRTKRWTESNIDPKLESEIAQLVDAIYALPVCVANGGILPEFVTMSPGAKLAWMAYFNAHAVEQVNLEGDLAAAWSKLEEYAARLALVIHCVRAAANDATLQDASAVDEASMAAGIQLATWFKGETRRVYAILGETTEERDRRRLVEWINRNGGTVTAREIQMGYRPLRAPGAAEAALEALVKEGLGTWKVNVTFRRGGRPSRSFVMSGPSTINETDKIAANDGSCVDVDKVSDSQFCGSEEGRLNGPPST